MTKAFPTSTLNSEPDRDDEVVERFTVSTIGTKLTLPMRRTMSVSKGEAVISLDQSLVSE
jgi:hypothetical protein